MFQASKPCPFCASTDNRIEEVPASGHMEYAVMCENCGAFGPNDLGQSGAVEMWDMRRDRFPCEEAGQDALATEGAYIAAKQAESYEVWQEQQAIAEMMVGLEG